MKIDRNLNRYIVGSSESLQASLEKLGQTNLQILFVVDSDMRLEAAFTDGDLRRWLLRHQQLDLAAPISAVANSSFVAGYVEDSPEKIADLLSERVTHVPLLDTEGKIQAIATLETRSISIGPHSINSDSPALLIAEIGNNHNGDVNVAKRLVDEAVAAGADCVKFQLRDMESLYRNQGDSNDPREDLGSQYVLDLLARYQLGFDGMAEVFDHCRAQGTEPLCTPFDAASVERLEEMGVVAYKVASADLTNHELLEYVAEKGKPMFCSTGMSTEPEILDSVNVLESKGARFVLLHCNSTYPAPFRDINLNYMTRLAELGGCFVGYSGHERGYHVPIAAVALGAKVVEKHFTLDKTMEGNDHKVSLLPGEFAEMTKAIRELEQAMGDREARRVSQGERLNRETLGKSLVVSRDVSEGEIFSADMIDIRSPGQGIPPYRKPDLIGKPALRDLKRGDFLYQSDLDGQWTKPRNYQFSQPFGIPVRYHDFLDLSPASNFSLIEFHLSYKDLDVDPGQFLEANDQLEYVVHAPELFANDHTLDLCADDLEYRQQSIRHLQDVVEAARELRQYFPRTQRPMIVTNVGGFTADGFLEAEQRGRLYDRLVESLSQLDCDDVEIIPQTMPPYPWHFGGQRFHNLFIDSAEINEFCVKHNMRVCFDVAHSKLACNEFDWNFREFTEIVAPHSGHFHVSDCRGTNDEGLQIGEGSIDFRVFWSQVRKLAPKASLDSRDLARTQEPRGRFLARVTAPGGP